MYLFYYITSLTSDLPLGHHSVVEHRFSLWLVSRPQQLCTAVCAWWGCQLTLCVTGHCSPQQIGMTQRRQSSDSDCITDTMWGRYHYCLHLSHNIWSRNKQQTRKCRIHIHLHKSSNTHTPALVYCQRFCNVPEVIHGNMGVWASNHATWRCSTSQPHLYSRLSVEGWQDRRETISHNY